mmetsp:Transcript_20952/g.44821  ORF Transcript_20952/g.44821 Transcript_20952/m.44821 type:complete len:183 (+) Transcript_20952:100-648(+)|eukprot:CAMPEP_0172553934 /NCGR_PEP_ID=MMETSP1067-20121228/52454_1 /TAXON_ID=265564 ORGANISM="Thalassiosira punctigera, Strain Tpunct2005C2" /NCGR_SAMPLE_ID=MMETSP1067 /ASSEMBLY_ACC=CAM_ASM_000444 /LENGTH=182 /DNA_ID=CAMNT_0013342211 /DNA_START=77 /DNA_END=625 /DNA_ORIENTATION=-
MYSLLAAYSLMVVAQTSGPEIIELLHGSEAKRAAQSLDPVLPDSADLCAEYEAAHFDKVSDVLHCAGMLALLLLLPVALLKSGNGGSSSKILWGPPVYYLPAWVGHYCIQKDIPAVFSYGTTLKGWWTGEWCAFKELFSGRILSTPVQWSSALVLAIIFVRLLTADASTATTKTISDAEKTK